ncbi:hypothetical protein GCM10010231_62730 [Streptomyces sindenensis]|nr:hypothetical protein GCM10010231_62730 [Streptomyces sindenensis]
MVATALRWFKAIRAAERPALGADCVDSSHMAVNETEAILTAGQLRTRTYLLMAIAMPRRVRFHYARASCFT